LRFALLPWRRGGISVTVRRDKRNALDNSSRIRSMMSGDAGAVLAIYAEGVAQGHATFECEVPDWTRFDRTRLKEPRLVIESADGVCGWALLSAVSARPVYDGVAEVTVYVAARAQGRGFGARLLTTLIEASEKSGLWTLQAAIFPENVASLRVHERCGFRVVGRRERIGYMRCGPMAGRWRDTIFLERRSLVTGDA
jgi:phosphinothricin acetyltransferase